MPHTRRTKNRLRAGRTKQHSTQVDNKARSPNGKSRKSLGYNGSPLVGRTPSGIVLRTPAVDGNERSTRPPLSASEPPAIESTDDVPSVIPVPTNNGVSPEELLVGLVLGLNLQRLIVNSGGNAISDASFYFLSVSPISASLAADRKNY